jgi:hypothetical protein
MSKFIVGDRVENSGDIGTVIAVRSYYRYRIDWNVTPDAKPEGSFDWDESELNEASPPVLNPGDKFITYGGDGYKGIVLDWNVSPNVVRVWFEGSRDTTTVFKTSLKPC